jgi:hypothetical protein
MIRGRSVRTSTLSQSVPGEAVEHLVERSWWDLTAQFRFCFLDLGFHGGAR